MSVSEGTSSMKQRDVPSIRYMYSPVAGGTRSSVQQMERRSGRVRRGVMEKEEEG
jgi:hypothetical protein